MNPLNPTVDTLGTYLSASTADPFYGPDRPGISPPRWIDNWLLQVVVSKAGASPARSRRLLGGRTFHNISSHWKPTPATVIIAPSCSAFGSSGPSSLEISSGVMYQPEYQKGVIWSDSATRDPEPIFLRDFALVFLALSRMDNPVEFIAAMNLEGSGASTPDHTHIHFMPTQYQPGTTSPVISLISQLVDGIRTKTKGQLYRSPSIEIQWAEITQPTWGFELALRWPTNSNLVQRAIDIARVIEVCVYRAVSLGSAQQLSFSLSIKSTESTEPLKIEVLVRDKDLERPFSAKPFLERIIGLKRATGICSSPAASWKWGWLECLGGLKVDSSWSHVTKITGKEWRRIFDELKPSPPTRDEVLNRVKVATTWL